MADFFYGAAPVRCDGVFIIHFDDVKTQLVHPIVAGFQKMAGDGEDLFALGVADRFRGRAVALSGARLHFDKADNAGYLCDYIYFAPIIFCPVIIPPSYLFSANLTNLTASA